jgi:hypothetical protein
MRRFSYLICLALVLAWAGTNTVFGAAVVDVPSGQGIEEQLDAGNLDTGSSDLEMPYESVGPPPSTPQMVGLRFANVNVPKGATITNAWVQFTADNEKLTGGAGTHLVIWGRLEANPGAFAGTKAVSTAPKTSASVKWGNMPDWTSGARGPDQRTPNLSVVIQELVNQSGWVPGNALALIIGDDPANKSTTVRSVQSASNLLALHIEYSSKYATSPIPADGALYTDTWVSLGWDPGQTAVTHDVYMSENKADVANGAAAAFGGNQALPFFLAGLGLPGDPYPNGLTPGATYYWRVDEVEANGTTKYAGPVWSFSVPPRKAYNPVPRNGGKYVPLDAKLTWTPGFGAKLHTVYFGTKLADVTNATTGGVMQGVATYTPPGPLTKGATYYWRVDEFDAQTTYKGDVWSFTAMADIPITNPDLIGWWKFDEGSGNKAIDFSGYGNDATFGRDPDWIEGIIGGALYLDGDDYLAIDGVVNDIKSTNMTLSIWIKTTESTEGNVFALNTGASDYALLFGIQGGNVYRWDTADQQFPPAINDDQWHMITYVRNGSTAYIYVDGIQRESESTSFTLDSITRWSIGQEWDDGTPSDFYYGAVDDARVYKKALTVDEIKELMRGDPLVAWKPNPDKGSTVDVEKARLGLTWSAGDNAAQHDVYFGTNQAAVAGATASDTTGVYRGRKAVASYTPTEVLAWGTGPYYWRIDEVKADGTITAGAVWSFSVANYLVVDDFEAYNDLNETDAGSNRIYLAWIDGYGTTTNGAVVGNLNPPFAETRRAYIHGGSQAMPVAYDNNRKSSQATRTLIAGKDWTRESVANLSLWFRGDTANAAERMYVSINGKAPVYNTNATAAQLTSYTEWVIPLSTFTAQGVSLANVTSITIGLGTPGNTTVAGGTGTVYIDDVRLSR